MLRKPGTAAKRRRGTSGGGGGLGDGTTIPSDLIAAQSIATYRDPVVACTGRGENATRIVTCCIVFPKGWFPSGSVACLRTNTTTANGYASGTLIRTQLDIHHRYDDNSAMVVLVTGEWPRLNDNETLYATLEKGTTHSSPGSDLTWSSFTSGKTVAMGFAGNNTASDVIPSVETGYWLQGPLRLQRRYANHNLGGYRVMADITFDKDGNWKVEGTWCNDRTFTSGGRVTGAATMTVNGSQVVTSGSVVHTIHSRFRRTWHSSATLPPEAKCDFTVAADAGLFPQYDWANGPSAGSLSTYQTLRAAGTWNDANDPRTITLGMGGTGNRPDIGWVMGQSVARICSDNIFWADLTNEMSEAAARIPWHTYDPATQSPAMVVGTNIDKWFSGSGPWTPAIDNGDAGWEPDTSHMPDAYLVPFLCTGSRSIMESLQAAASYAISNAAPFYRNQLGGTNPADGDCCALMDPDIPLRTVAWAMRSILFGWITSPTEGVAATAEMLTYRDYLYDVLIGNYKNIKERIPRWNSQHGEYAGFIGDCLHATDSNPPWQQDHFLHQLCCAWDFGFEDAGRILGWLADGWMGRRCEDHGGVWNRKDGVAYSNPKSHTVSGVVTWVNTWAQAATRIVAMGESNGAGWDKTAGGNYGQLGTASFARLADKFPTRTYLAAQYDWLNNPATGVPYVAASNLRDVGDMACNSVRRGTTRT